MPNRVVFFLDSAFSKRDYVRFGFDIIKARGYDVEAWNFLPVLQPIYCRSYIPPDTIDFARHRLFTHHQHIVEAISGLSKEDVVVCLIGHDGDSAFIFDLLEKQNVHYGFCMLGLLPRASVYWHMHELLHRFVSSPAAFLGKMLNILWEGMLRKMAHSQHVISPRFIMTGGAAANNDRRYPVLGTANIIKAHALDYDRYLEEEEPAHLDEGKAGDYALFLDDDIPLHSDYIIFDVNPYCTADSYYSELNKFFDSFERTTGLSIIIAAHPRADYEKRGNPYGNRKLVCGKTVSYTKRAKLVLAHVSTSLNFAILYKKPVIFMDSLEYSMALRLWIRDTAVVFGQTPLIISGDATFRLPQLTINDELYERFKNLYIKESGTPNKMCWCIFCDYVDKLKQHRKLA